MTIKSIGFPCGCKVISYGEDDVQWSLNHCRPAATADLLAALKVLVSEMRIICDFTPGQKSDPTSIIGCGEAAIAKAEPNVKTEAGR